MTNLRDFLASMNSATTATKGTKTSSSVSGMSERQNKGNQLEQIKKEFSEALDKIQRLGLPAVDAPITIGEAVDLKRKGKYRESSKFYADYVLTNRIFTPMLAMSWYKTLASAGDLSDALKIVDYLDSLQPPSCYATNMLNQHKEGLLELINNKDYSALVSYLSSISGNPNYQIAREDIDLFSESGEYWPSSMIAQSVPAEIIISSDVIKAYNTIRFLVEKMDKAIMEIYNYPQHKRSDHIIANQMRMDCILQGILLHVALSDGNLSHTEQYMITKIVNHGQILDMMRVQTSGRLDYSMQEIASMTRQEKLDFLQLMDYWIKNTVSDELIVSCAAFDSVSQKTDKTDFCEWMCKLVEVIATFLASADGPMQPKEAIAINDSINRLLRNPWIAQRTKFSNQ